VSVLGTRLPQQQGQVFHLILKTLTVVLLTVVQDSTGRLATILFAWLASSSLGAEPQKYRLLADLFNDLALLSDCTVPRILAYRLPLLCFSGVSRALCGVIANGVGATMTAHFAKRGNLADVSAKSASLGTVAQLLGTMVYFPMNCSDVGGDVIVASNSFGSINLDDLVRSNFASFGLEL
jgi:hypothetical protein